MKNKLFFRYLSVIIVVMLILNYGHALAQNSEPVGETVPMLEEAFPLEMMDPEAPEMVPYNGPMPDRDLPPWRVEEQQLNSIETESKIPPRSNADQPNDGFGQFDGQRNSLGEPILLQGSTGLYYTNSDASIESATQNVRATGGPDEYGYTWDDSIAFDWIDVSGGTDTGISSSVEYTGAIDLGFDFRFYENTYSQIYISRHGFLSFNDTYLDNIQSPIPSTELPDDVIAPFWVSSDDIDYVKYMTGGVSPDRWMVIEWNNLLSFGHGSPDDYTFEAILHENGNITFQYGLVIHDGGYCGAAGIEDNTGLDGLSVVDFCEQPSPSSSVLISRPPNGPRMGLTPRYQGDLFEKADVLDYQIQIENNGDFGGDTFDINSSSAWPVSLYQQDCKSPLTDTDSDGIIDTGLIEPGNVVDLCVKITPPDPIQIGENNSAVIEFTSSIDIHVSKSGEITSALPANFAQVYRDEDLNGNSFALFSPDYHNEQLINDYGTDLAVVELINGDFIYLWSDYRWLDNDNYVYEVKYALFDHGGNQISNISVLSDLGTPNTIVWDQNIVAAVTPDGNIGVLWSRHRWDRDLDIRNYNIVFAILDQEGNIIHPPEEVTNNDVWGGNCYEDLNMPCYYDTGIAATGDNHFSFTFFQVITEMDEINYQDVFLGIRSSVGTPVLPLENFTRGVTGFVSNNSPSITGINGNEILLTYGNSGFQYVVLDSSGNMIHPITDTYYYLDNVDAIQLSGGNIMVAGDNWNEEILFFIMDGNSYSIVESLTTIPNPANPGKNRYVSMTKDGLGHAILTWMGSDSSSNNELYYALLDQSGTILTPPMAFRSSITEIVTSYQGNGNTTYTPMASVSLSPWRQAGFGSSGDKTEFALTLTNTGNLGPDTFNLSVTSDYTANIFAADGTTPITNTGTLDMGQSFDFIVKIDIPTSANVGDSGSTDVTVISTLDPSKSPSASIDLTIPAPFAQALYDASYGSGLYLIQPESQTLKGVAINSNPYQVAVAEMPGGNIVYAGSQMYMSWDGTGDPIYFTNINYSILDHGGDPILPQKMIELNPDPSVETSIQGPVIDVAPNGNIGMLWINELYDPISRLSNFNLIMLVMDSVGNIFYGPTDLTGNTSWGNNNSGDAFGYESPRIVASDDGKFFISWGAYDQEPEGYIRDIYYGIRNNDGSQSIANAKLTNGVVGGDFNYEPALAALDGNKTLIAWHGSGETKYLVMNNDGSIAKASTAISGPGLINIDAIQLSDGDVLLAGQNGSREIFFSTLDGSTFAVISPLAALMNPIAPSNNVYVSVTKDENGHGILTWADSTSQNLYYALVNSSGDVLTDPSILLMAEDNFPTFLLTNSEGYGNTTYSPAAWIEVLDKEIYGFVSQGAHEYAFTVQNLGSLGPDRVDFDVSVSGWGFALYEPDGTTPLTDTDSDGLIDTGLLAEGEEKTIIAKLTVPPTAVVGDYLQGSITATSNLNPDLNISIQVSLAIPSSFAQIFEENDQGLHMSLIGSEHYRDIQLSDYGNDMAVLQLPNGNILSIWTDVWCTDVCVGEIKYNIINSNGENVIPTAILDDHSGATIFTFDYAPQVSVLPNGIIGVTWYREKQNQTTGLINDNIYFAVLDGTGTLSHGPINLTNNEIWGDYSTGNIGFYPTIKATIDGSFMLAWSRYDSLSSTRVSEIYYGIYSIEGSELLTPVKVTESIADEVLYYRPHLTALQDGNIFLNWFKYEPISYAYTPQFLVVDSDGAVVKTTEEISGDARYFSDGVQLSNGKIFLAGSGGDDDIYYSIISSDTYAILVAPTELNNSLRSVHQYYPSVTHDQEGNAILTWLDFPTNSSEDNYLYYALVDGEGSVLTPPTIMAAARYLSTSTYGLGNTTYSEIIHVNSPPTINSTAETEAAQDSAYNYAISASDPDMSLGDTLTLSAPTIPDWLSLDDNGDGTGMLSGTPSNDDVGPHPVEIVVTDSEGLTDSQSFTVTVTNINDEPSFTSISITEALQSTLYTYTIETTDPDLIHGDSLEISATTLPSWLILTDNGDGTGTLSGTPSMDDVGDHSIVLVVTDDHGLTDTQSFTITVMSENVNDPPSFTSDPVTVAEEDKLYSYEIVATDPDLIFGDTLTIEATTLPTWLSLVDNNDGTAVLSGIPSSLEIGDHSVVLVVTDDFGETDSQSFIITVDEAMSMIFLPLIIH